MPRIRRAAAPDAPLDERAATGTPDTAPAQPASAAEQAANATPVEPTTSPAKPRSRRTARSRATSDPAPEALPATTADEDAPVGDFDPEAPTEAAVASPEPKRRGGRRRSTSPAAETDVTPPSESAVTPEPIAAAPQSAPSRRRGSRKASNADASQSDSVVQSPTIVDDVPEGVSVEESSPTEDAAPAKRRIGGRRTKTSVDAALPEPANIPVAELPDVEAPTIETTAAAPSGRRRRRRGGGGGGASNEPASLQPTEAITDELEAGPEASEVESLTADASGDEEGSRKGRRRRSRRKRNGEIELPTDQSETGEGLLSVPELVVVEDADEDIDTGLDLMAPPPPVYVAPPLVTPVLALPDGATLPRVQASVEAPTPRGGLRQIHINGTAYPPFSFFVNAEAATDGEAVDAQIRQAAAAGIHLYSSVIYLPLRNAYGERSFGATEALLRQILDNDPDAYILPRLQFAATNFWARTHPDQMAQYADGSEGDVSLASTEFWADCVDALEALIAYLADPNTFGGDRVIGFHLDRGEWFYDRSVGYDRSKPNVTAFRNWLHAKYQFPYALRSGWFNGSVTFDDAQIPEWPGEISKPGDSPLYSGAREGRWPDYAAFSSELVAQAINGLAAAVKTLSNRQMIVGVSYGYTLEFAVRNDSGHLALGQVLASPDIDILAGPNSYTGRGAGSPGAFGAPIDSVALHNKLWLVEDDTKTFLASEETPDTYNPKIASGADTQAAHERHFGAALAHRAGVTWMDLWGQGWLNREDIWRALGRLRDQAGRLGEITTSPTLAPEVAVLIDEASLAYFKNNPAGLGQALIGKSRDLLLRSGASVGFYLQSDVTRENFPDAKLYLFLNALRLTTPERQAIRERLQKPGKTLAWLYAPGMFDERGLAEQEMGDTVGMALRVQPWDSRVGSVLTDVGSPITERLRSGKRTHGQEEILNPSYCVVDPQATVLAEYTQSGAPSLAVREHASGWKSVFIGDPHLTTELLRGLYVYAGVQAYETQDDVVYAGDGVLLIHAPFTGQRNISLPRPATVYDVLEDKIVASDTRTFRSFLRSRTTKLFLWGEADAVTSATGLSLPTPEQAADSKEAGRKDSTPDPSALMEQSDDDAETTISADNETDTVVFSMPSVLVDVDDADVDETDAEEATESDLVASTESGTAEGGANGSARRSRWQRRRAALRARREAERAAAPSDSNAGGADADSAPVDIAALLPGLPPRRTAAVPPTEAPPSLSDD